MSIKKELREYMSKIGRKGGKSGAAKLTSQQRREKGQAAVRNRWKGHTAQRRIRRASMSPRLRRKNDFDGSLYRNPCPTCGAQPFDWCISLGRIPKPGDPHADRQAKLSAKTFERNQP